MISMLERYIAKTILLATALTTVLISGVLLLLRLLAELKNIGEGDYGLNQALIYVLLRLPNDYYQFSPILLMLGSIVGLSILSSARELMVMRASGFAIRKIFYSVFAAALLLIVIASFIGEWVGPDLSYKAEVRKENMEHAGQAVVTSKGVWFHLDNNFIHVQHVVNRMFLENVTRYQFDNNRHLEAAYFAKSLAFHNGEWTMNDVVKTTFNNDRAKSEAFAQTPWELKFNPNLFNVGLVEPKEMSIPKLANFIDYLDKNGLQSATYEYVLWTRLLQPIASLIMIFLAIPFVLGTMSTSTLGWRLLMGMTLGFAFFILNALIGQLSIVYQVPAFIAAMLPLGVFFLVTVILSKKVIRM